jgi:hypothetical protein
MRFQQGGKYFVWNYWDPAGPWDYKSDPRWKGSPGVLWTAIVPHDETLRKLFEANHKPESWGGLAITPWYCAELSKLR